MPRNRWLRTGAAMDRWLPLSSCTSEQTLASHLSAAPQQSNSQQVAAAHNAGEACFPCAYSQVIAYRCRLARNMGPSVLSLWEIARKKPPRKESYPGFFSRRYMSHIFVLFRFYFCGAGKVRASPRRDANRIRVTFFPRRFSAVLFLWPPQKTIRP